MEDFEKKIVFDARVMTNRISGLERYCLGLLKGLKSIDQTNQYLILVHSSLKESHPVFFLEGENFAIKRVSIKALSPIQQLRMPMRLPWRAFDLYHYPHFDMPLFLPLPKVVTVHDLKYIKHPQFFPSLKGSKVAYMKLFLSLAIKKARRVIADSSCTKQDLMELFGVSSERIRIVPMGVEDSLNSIEVEEALSRHGMKERYFLFIGERRPHKNLLRLIEAYHLLKNRVNPLPRLVIAGKGYAAYPLPEKKARELNLEREILFMDYIPEEELPYWFRGAEAFLFPSLYEGFGLPILEAMALEVPVITSGVSSMPEVAGDAALLVDPYKVEEIAEAMERLLTQKELRASLIERGRERARAFSWQKAAEKTLDVYREIWEEKFS